MKIIALCVGVVHETWFRDTRDERQVSLLSLVDADSFLDKKLGQMLTYAPSPDEQKELLLDKLDMVKLSIAVSEIRPSQGGKLGIRGMIDRSTVPAAAVVAKAATPAKG